eukprot:GAHX01001678.1.p1 GENE.GAHX01001678.1~~GAHX01001678.1.p1  ORF type:complete len:660 (-),score=126.63 GAHX01001678.1:56-2035(-)
MVIENQTIVKLFKQVNNQWNSGVVGYLSFDSETNVTSSITHLIIRDREASKIILNTQFNQLSEFTTMDSTLIELSTSENSYAISFRDERIRNEVYTLIEEYRTAPALALAAEIKELDKNLNLTKINALVKEKDYILLLYFYSKILGIDVNSIGSKRNTRKTNIKCLLPQSLCEMAILKIKPSSIQKLLDLEGPLWILQMLDFIFGTNFLDIYMLQTKSKLWFRFCTIQFQCDLNLKAVLAAFRRMVNKKHKVGLFRKNFDTLIERTNIQLLQELINNEAFQLKEFKRYGKECFESFIKTEKLENVGDYVKLMIDLLWLVSQIRNKDTLKKRCGEAFVIEEELVYVYELVKIVSDNRSNLAPATNYQIVHLAEEYIENILKLYSSDTITPYLRALGIPNSNFYLAGEDIIKNSQNLLYRNNSNHIDDVNSSKDALEHITSILFSDKLPEGLDEIHYTSYVEIICRLMKTNYPLSFNNYLKSVERISIQTASFKTLFFKRYFKTIFKRSDTVLEFNKNVEIKIRHQLEILRILIDLYWSSFKMNIDDKILTEYKITDYKNNIINCVDVFTMLDNIMYITEMEELMKNDKIMSKVIEVFSSVLNGVKNEINTGMRVKLAKITCIANKIKFIEKSKTVFSLQINKLLHTIINNLQIMGRELST